MPDGPTCASITRRVHIAPTYVVVGSKSYNYPARGLSSSTQPATLMDERKSVSATTTKTGRATGRSDIKQLLDGDTEGSMLSIWRSDHGGLHKQQAQRCDAGPTSFQSLPASTFLSRYPRCQTSSLLQHHVGLTLTARHTALDLTRTPAAIASSRLRQHVPSR